MFIITLSFYVRIDECTVFMNINRTRIERSKSNLLLSDTQYFIRIRILYTTRKYTNKLDFSCFFCPVQFLRIFRG